MNTAGAIELRHLRYFIAVAEELHFGRAAARLNMAQPPLSQQIRQLEAMLGEQLFSRTSRSVELTPAGVALLPGARRTLAEAALLAEVARRAARGEVDTLRIGFTDSAALSVLPQIVRRCRTRHPEIHLELREASTREQLEAIERDLIDLALVRGPVTTPGLRTDVIYRESFIGALPSDHALAARKRIALKSLAGPMVLFPRHLAPVFHDQIIRMCHDAGFRPDVRAEAADYQAMLSLVAAGLGVSVVPASVANLARAGVTYRGLTRVTQEAQIVMIYRERRLRRALSAIIAIAREEAAATARHVREGRLTRH